MNAGGERITLAAFLACAVFAGGNGVGIRFSNRELEPLWGASLRFLLAAAALVAVMAALRLALPRGRALRGALLYGGLNFGASYALIYYGLVHVHAGLAQTLLALVPLAALFLAVLQRQERFRVGALVGSLLAVGGVAVMSQAPLREAVPLLSLLALIASAFCFAQAAVLVRHFPQVHAVTMNAVGMATGAMLLVVGALVVGQPLSLPERAATWGAVAYLVVVGSVLVFLLYLFVLERWSASRTAYGFVLTPVVTIALSAWLDGEPLGAGLVLGGLLVLVGVYVGALRPARVPPTLAEVVPPRQ
jgi:drug/metabolite transporter (DMT)-like permease